MSSRRATECALAVLCLGTAAAAALPPQVVLQKTYTRDKAGPDSFNDTFTACDPAGQFTIAVDNGGVSSATVAVNGVEVIHQSDFNQKVTHLERALPAMLAASSVAVRLTSNPGGNVQVTIAGVMNCGFRIQSPASGAIVTGTPVIVSGNVPASFGADVGVTVNGTVATVSGGAFAAAVPVDATIASLTAVAVDAAGNEKGRDTIPISVQLPAGSSDVVLIASPPSGLAPLTVELRVSTQVNLTDVKLDQDGNGTVDFDGASIDGMKVTFAAPGFYTPVITAIDDAGRTYTSRAVVQVYDRSPLEALLQSKWSAMKDALRAGNTAAAAQSVIPDARARYQSYFDTIAADLPNIDSILTPITLDHLRNGTDAIGVMTRTGADGVTKTFSITFRIDADGIWRLQSF